MSEVTNSPVPRVERRSSPVPLAEAFQQHMQSSSERREPVPVVNISLIEMIQRTNEYLYHSPNECLMIRMHVCSELEYYLIKANNFHGYDFLENPVRDATRRRYRISSRLSIAHQTINHHGQQT